MKGKGVSIPYSELWLIIGAIFILSGFGITFFEINPSGKEKSMLILAGFGCMVASYVTRKNKKDS